MRERLARAIGHARFLRLGLRTRLVNLLRPWDPLVGSEIAEAFQGYTYRGNVADFQDYYVRFFGAFEPAEVQLMGLACSAIEGCVAYDIGASTGHHALALAAVCKEVHGFEPFERVRSVAEQRMRENGLDHVTIHSFGLGEVDERLPYFWDESNTNCMAGSFSEAYTRHALHKLLEVRNGDAWRRADAAPPPDFIKLDVECFEAFALAGLRETLATSEPAILFEVTAGGYDNIQSKGGLRSLVPYAFDLFRVEPGRNLLVFDFSGLRLTRVETLRRPEKWGHNLFLLPHGRRQQLTNLERLMV